jgi:hypothetical protein
MPKCEGAEKQARFHFGVLRTGLSAMTRLLKLAAFLVLIAVLFVCFSPVDNLDPSALQAARAANLVMSLIAIAAFAAPRILSLPSVWQCRWDACPEIRSTSAVPIFDLDGARLC